uniref:Aquaporin n=1 Tax=Onchocerca volvulus TaxID=6282 RepID=A0A8R1TKL2_ONCVO
MYSESVLAPIPKMRNLSPGVFHSTSNGWYQFDCSFRCILCDSRNQIPRNLMPVLFGIIATTISICCGLNMGSPVNPASDFGGRIFASSVGYGVQLFTFHHCFFLVLLLASIMGAAIGVYYC